MTPAAGWYADPWHPAGERWWDGASWTRQTRIQGAPPGPRRDELLTFVAGGLLVIDVVGWLSLIFGWLLFNPNPTESGIDAVWTIPFIALAIGALLLTVPGIVCEVCPLSSCVAICSTLFLAYMFLACSSW